VFCAQPPDLAFALMLEIITGHTFGSTLFFLSRFKPPAAISAATNQTQRKTQVVAHKPVDNASG